MLESYLVGVRLNMTSNAPKILGELSRKFETLERQFVGARDGLRSFERQLHGMSGASRSLKGVQELLAKIGNTRFGEATNMSEVLRGTRDIAVAAREMESAWKGTATAIAEAARASGRLRMPGANGGGRGGSGGGGTGGGEGGDGDGSSEPHAGWNSAARAAYPNAVFENRNIDHRQRQAQKAADATYAAAVYDNSEVDRRRKAADEEFFGTYGEAQDEDRARTRAAAGKRRAEDREYRDGRGLAERENQDRDIRARAAQRQQQAAEAHDKHMTHMGWDMAAFGAERIGSGTWDFAKEAFEPAAELMFQKKWLQSQDKGVAAVSPEMADRAEKAAYDATKAAPGTTQNVNMELLRHSMDVTNSLPESIEMLPSLAKLYQLLNLINERKGVSDPTLAAQKAIELMGETTDYKVVDGHTVPEFHPERLPEMLNRVGKIAMGTENVVDPGRFYSLATTGSLALMRMTDKAKWEDMPAIAENMNPSRLGTAITSLYQVMKGGRMTEKTYDALVSVGLAKPLAKNAKHYKGVGEDGKYHSNRDLVDADGVYNLEDMTSDHLKYIDEARVLMDNYGIHGKNAQIDALNRAGQRAPIARYFGDLYANEVPIRRSADRIHNQRGNLADFMMQDDNPKAKQMEFNAAWINFLTTLGTGIMPMAVTVLKDMTAGLTAISDWANRNKSLKAVLSDTAIGLGLLAGAIGALSVAVIAAAPGIYALRKLAGAVRGAGGLPDVPGAPPGGPRAAGAGIMSDLGVAGALGWAGTVTESWRRDAFSNMGLKGKDLAGALAGGVVIPDSPPHGAWGGPAAPMPASKAGPAGTPHDPLHVTVTNPGNGAAATDKVLNSLAGPQKGPTGFDPSAGIPYSVSPGGW